jgi:hypothetical protein
MNPLSLPGVLDVVTKYSTGYDVHRLAGTSSAFARAAIRFDDTMVRTIRVLQDHVASVRAQMHSMDRESDRLLHSKCEATDNFLFVLMQFAPLAEIVSASNPIFFFGRAHATAYIIRYLRMHPNDGVRSSIERISVLVNALWTNEPPPGLPQRRSPWQNRVRTEIQAQEKALFKRVKPDFETLRPFWSQWWDFGPLATEEFLDRVVYECAPHANELIVTLEQIQLQKVDLDNQYRTVKKEIRATQSKLTEAIKKMGNPRLGTIPKNGTPYRLPTNFTHLGQNLRLPPPQTRTAIAKRQKLMNAM